MFCILKFGIILILLTGHLTKTIFPCILEVMMAILFTTVVVVALTVFAMQTKWDFTTCGGTLFVTLWIFILIGFIMAFTPKTDAMVIVISSVGAIIFSVYLIRKKNQQLWTMHIFFLIEISFYFEQTIHNLLLAVITNFQSVQKNTFLLLSHCSWTFWIFSFTFYAFWVQLLRVRAYVDDKFKDNIHNDWFTVPFCDRRNL